MILLLTYLASSALAGALGTHHAHTMSDVHDALGLVEFAVLLEPALSEDQLRQTDTFLMPLSEHIDLNVIGQGRDAWIDADKILDAVIDGLERGETLNAIGHDLVKRYRRGELSKMAGSEDGSAPVDIGGLFVAEAEYHQEPDGHFAPLIEINQFRMYFSADANPTAEANRVAVLAEWNPVPEEVIHQIEDVEVNGGVLSLPERPIIGLINFEQLHASIQSIGGSPIGLTMGQIRNPFGFWSDYTSHRNFTTTKNATVVNGFALKKIELGFQMSARSGPIEADVAVVHGRFGRTFPLDRVDIDDSKDLVGRVRASGGAFGVGASAYLHEFQTRNMAVGLEWQIGVSRLTLAGEAVYQQNLDPDEVYGRGVPVDKLASFGSYAQAEASISQRLHVFGMYEGWQLYADGEAHNPVAGKVFHGVRYLFDERVRWTIVEWGHMFHEGYDHGHEHLSTQFEVSF